MWVRWVSPHHAYMETKHKPVSLPLKIGRLPTSIALLMNDSAGAAYLNLSVRFKA